MPVDRYKNRTGMKYESTTGCICDSLTVDGTETSDMDLNELKDALWKLIGYVKDPGCLQSIIRDIVEMYGEYTDLGHCDECGDSIDRYTLEL